MQNSEVNKRWRRQNPLAYSAHMILAAAIRAGKMTPQPCEKCGQVKAHAHHADYTKPLEVTWLCSKHHRQYHALATGQTLHAAPETRKPPAWPYRIKFQPAPKREASINQARTLRERGMSYREIAGELGLTQGTVFKWLNPREYK